MKNEEIYDVVNKKDEVIGPATREELHSNPKLIHRTVHFTLLDRSQRRVILTKFSPQKEHDASRYCFLGEHILSGETYNSAVKRGVKEELGFIPRKFREVGDNIFTYQKQTEFVRFFIVDWDGKKIKWDKREIEKAFWVDIDHLSRSEYDFSSMTRYWIEVIDWQEI